MSRSLNQCIDRLPTRVGETSWSLTLTISIYSPLLLLWTLLEIVGLLAGSCQWGSWSWPSLVHSWDGVLSSSIWDTLVSRISVRAVVAEALAQLLWPEVNKTCTDINSPRSSVNHAWRSLPLDAQIQLASPWNSRLVSLFVFLFWICTKRSFAG